MNQAIDKLDELRYKKNIVKTLDVWASQGKRSNTPIVNDQFRVVDGKLVQVLDPRFLAAVKRTVVPKAMEIVGTETVQEDVSAVEFAEVCVEK